MNEDLTFWDLVDFTECVVPTPKPEFRNEVLEVEQE